MFFKDFSKAISTYSRAISLFNQLKLWKYLLVPILIGFLVGSGIITLSYTLADNVGDYLSSFWPWDFGADTVKSIGKYLGGFIILIFGLIVFKHAVMAFSAPFMAPVSEKIEMHLTGKPLNKTDTAGEFLAILLRSIKINLRNLILELLITIPLLILSLIPLINIVATVLLIYIQSYYVGFGNMDYTLERHRDFSGSVKFVRKHKGIAVGNGFVFVLMLAIPVVGMCLALPIAAGAATINTVEKLEMH